MRSSVLHTLLIAGIVAAITGCQSAGRWAWWKRGQASDATTLAETSSAPTLPSESATPQAVAVAGLEPVASPSASNLAATGVPSGITQVSAPPLAAPGTPASAIAVSPNSPIPGIPTIPGVGGAMEQVAAVPSAGPYDPNAYKPSTSSAATSAPIAGDIPAVADRYAFGSAGPYQNPPSTLPSTPTNPGSSSETAPATPYSRQSAMDAIPPASPSSTQDDRYAMRSTTGTTAADRYSHVFAEPPASAVAKQSSDSSVTAAQQTSTAVAQTAPPTAPSQAATTTQTVQLKSPAGQYRPGGTSSYAAAPVQHMEVATRQAVGATPSATGSDSWTPPVPAAPTTGVRTY